MIDYDKRRDALLDSLDADAFLIVNLEGSDSVSMFYLTGFTGEGALLLSAKEASLMTDSRYTEQASREVPRLPVKEMKGDYLKEVAAMLKERKLKRVAVSSKRMTHYVVEKLHALFGGEIIAFEDPVMALRRLKDPEEIARIREATRLAEASLTALLGEIKIGVSERELALRLEVIMRKNGAEKVAFDLIVAAGDNSALPHYRPGTRELRQGDLLLFDIGAQLDGYCSDMTRVFAVKEVLPQAREIYELVLRANQAGIKAIRAGASGVAVDTIARDVIAQAGHKEHFGHGLGHGVGLEVHEGPLLSPLSEDTLEPWMVVTMEPGVYLPGFGGVRIEDLLVVTKDGSEVLTSLPKDRLIEVG